MCEYLLGNKEYRIDWKEGKNWIFENNHHSIIEAVDWKIGFYFVEEKCEKGVWKLADYWRPNKF